MIRRIGSDLETFKKLEFGPGLNVLLADKSEGASDRQSRNRAGKTSFVEIVHFLTGGNVGKDSIFRSSALKESTFTIQMDVGGDGFTVARSGSAPGKVQVNGSVEGWPIESTFNQDAGVFEISITNWCRVLGCKWFGLDALPNPDTKFQPTFRSLFSYFVRRQASGGFNKPKTNAAGDHAANLGSASRDLISAWIGLACLTGFSRPSRERKDSQESGKSGAVRGTWALLRTCRRP